MNITGYILAAAIVLLIPQKSFAAGKIQYGSRVGEQVSVISVNGLGTDRAVIQIEHTAEDAKEHCVAYSNDNSNECVQKLLRDTYLNNKLLGNCVTGVFTTLYGETVRFDGEDKHSDEYIKYVLRDAKGDAIPHDNADNFFVDIEQFNALCPGKIDMNLLYK